MKKRNQFTREFKLEAVRLQEEGYKVHLANPSAIKQYEGLKHTDDKWDSFWLAHMKRLNNNLDIGFLVERT